MARKLKSFPEADIGRPNLYPWDDWLSGEVWKLKRGVDFTVEPRSLVSAAYHAAARYNVSIRTVTDENSVTIQAEANK